MSDKAAVFKARGLIAFSGVLYGTLSYFGLSIRTEFSLWMMLFWRFLGAALVLWLVLVFQKQSYLKPLQNYWRSFASTSILYGIAAGCLFASSERIGTGLGMVMFFMYPLFVTGLDWFFGEHVLTFQTLVCIVLGMVGVIFLGGFSGQAAIDPWGFALGLLGAIFYAFYLFFSKDQVKKSHPLVVAMYMCLGSSLFALLCVLTCAGLAGSLSFPDKLSFSVALLRDLVMISVVCTALPVVLMLQGLRWVSAPLAAILSVLRPVTTILVGAVFLSEHLNGFQVLGMVLIMSSTVLIQLKVP